MSDAGARGVCPLTGRILHFWDKLKSWVHACFPVVFFTCCVHGVFSISVPNKVKTKAMFRFGLTAIRFPLKWHRNMQTLESDVGYVLLRPTTQCATAAKKPRIFLFRIMCVKSKQYLSRVSGLIHETKAQVCWKDPHNGWCSAAGFPYWLKMWLVMWPPLCGTETQAHCVVLWDTEVWRVFPVQVLPFNYGQSKFPDKNVKVLWRSHSCLSCVDLPTWLEICKIQRILLGITLSNWAGGACKTSVSKAPVALRGIVPSYWGPCTLLFKWHQVRVRVGHCARMELNCNVLWGLRITQGW